jgi:hypothetical protein
LLITWKKREKFKSWRTREVVFNWRQSFGIWWSWVNLKSMHCYGSVVYNQKTGKNDTVAGFRTTNEPLTLWIQTLTFIWLDLYCKKDLPAVDAIGCLIFLQVLFTVLISLITTVFLNHWAWNQVNAKSKSYLNWITKELKFQIKKKKNKRRAKA